MSNILLDKGYTKDGHDDYYGKRLTYCFIYVKYNRTRDLYECSVGNDSWKLNNRTYYFRGLVRLAELDKFEEFAKLTYATWHLNGFS